MGRALYRKYRSRSLDEIVGQVHITGLLSRQIEAGNIAHAYLLTGPRGVGKTSIARILAHEINQLPYSEESNHLDIIEIDAASNNGVEDVRDLREKVHIAPTSARYKVYIIDEVHMLSKAAFNALLKTLEEPPSHVIFVLATTDADKLPATIISRVQRYNFRSIVPEDVARHLRFIAEREKIAISDEALDLIAHHGDGSFRDSIGLLDQLRHSAVNEKIERSDVEATLGLGDLSLIASLIDSYRQNDLAKIAKVIYELESTGAQASVVAKQLIAKLSSELPAYPDDALTLDKLLEVNHSQFPYIKLLTALANTQNNGQIAIPKDSINDKPKASKPPTVVSSNLKENTKSTQPTSSHQSKQAEKASKPLSLDIDFDYTKLVSQAKEISAGLATILSKTGYDYGENGLVIYAGGKFNSKQLQSAKRQSELSQALESCGWSNINVMINESKKPLANSQTASVAAIMGGGEEVEYSE